MEREIKKKDKRAKIKEPGCKNQEPRAKIKETRKKKKVFKTCSNFLLFTFNF